MDTIDVAVVYVDGPAAFFCCPHEEKGGGGGAESTHPESVVDSLCLIYDC